MDLPKRAKILGTRISLSLFSGLRLWDTESKCVQLSTPRNRAQPDEISNQNELVRGNEIRDLDRNQLKTEPKT